uniref:Uncharacterized protein n=1 Tax=Lepeophtheirus salmonis TaxID=72036 RepID=A0A0K2UA23_LEPSM
MFIISEIRCYRDYSNKVMNNTMNGVEEGLSFKWRANSLSNISFFWIRIGHAPWIPTC